MQRKCCRQAANPTTDNDYLHGTSQKVSGTTQLPGTAARRVVETTENMTTATRSDLRTIAARCEMAISAARARIYRVLHGSSFNQLRIPQEARIGASPFRLDQRHHCQC